MAHKRVMVRTVLSLVVAAFLTLQQGHAQPSPRYVPTDGELIEFENNATSTKDGQLLSEVRTWVQQRVTSVQPGMRWEATTTVTRRGERDGELLAPATKERFDAMLAQSRVAYRAFLPVAFALVPPRLPEGSSGLSNGFGPGPPLQNWLDCPWDEFERFFPIGRTSLVSMRCSRGSNSSLDGEVNALEIQLLMADEGSTFVHTATGDLPLRRIRLTEISGADVVTEELLLFSERLGITVQSDSTRRIQSVQGGPVLMTSHTELRR